MTTEDEIELVVARRHSDPHHVLGAHPADDRVVIRAFRPDAREVIARVGGGKYVTLWQRHPAGLFEGFVPDATLPLRYELEVSYPDGNVYTLRDPYAFAPTLGDLDLHLVGEGRHEELYECLGAHVREIEGVLGTSFAVWAPSALAVSVVGDFNSWDGRLHAMRVLGGSGIWEIFIPDVVEGAAYKFEILTQAGEIRMKADPFAFQTVLMPRTDSIVHRPRHVWRDAEWMERRRATRPYEGPMSIYEVHLGSWRLNPLEGNRSLTYLELADELAAYVGELGFTHVELMPVMEHAFAGSWGYQVTSYFAPTARFGSPDDFKQFVDHLHGRGIGVIVDWVPAHFPRDDWALARFDGTSLYEHDHVRGAHPDWGTLIFNYGRHEVRNFLEASAFFWTREFHVDGIRVDGVASMLYLDYSRNEGEWIPNVHGGREDLDAISFIQEMNEIIHRREPGVISVAEESTAWGGVSHPTHAAGLGFGFKWNMGWMHDTLGYFQHDPVYRTYHHHELTLSLLYAFTENFILPLSHDEVVHGKRSLYEQMAGDRWQKLANLRALYGYMWAHPGMKLLFMGGEFAQEQEWSYQRSIDWHLLERPEHAGVQRLVRELNHRLREEPALTSRTSSPAASGGLNQTTRCQTCSPSHAPPETAIACSYVRPTSPRPARALPSRPPSPRPVDRNAQFRRRPLRRLQLRNAQPHRCGADPLARAEHVGRGHAPPAGRHLAQSGTNLTGSDLRPSSRRATAIGRRCNRPPTDERTDRSGRGSRRQSHPRSKTGNCVLTRPTGLVRREINRDLVGNCTDGFVEVVHGLVDL